jgi:hypothetical protein
VIRKRQGVEVARESDDEPVVTRAAEVTELPSARRAA